MIFFRSTLFFFQVIVRILRPVAFARKKHYVFLHQVTFARFLGSSLLPDPRCFFRCMYSYVLYGTYLFVFVCRCFSVMVRISYFILAMNFASVQTHVEFYVECFHSFQFTNPNATITHIMPQFRCHRTRNLVSLVDV